MAINPSRIVLIEPVGGMNFTPDPSKRGNSTPPYAIECLAGYLKDQGFDPEIIHQRPVTVPRSVLDPEASNGDELVEIQITDDLITEMILDKAKGEPGMIVGLSAITGLMNRSLMIARKVKLRNPEIKIAIGGYHPSSVKEKAFKSVKLNTWEQDLRERLLELRFAEYPEDQKTDELKEKLSKELRSVNLVDFLVAGEGEKTITELARAVSQEVKEGKTNYSEISGIIYRETDPETGETKLNQFKPRERIKPKEGEQYISLPPAYREIEVPVTDENGKFLGAKRLPSDLGCTQFGTFPASDEIKGEIQMSYSRGCSGRCSFCSSYLVWCNGTMFRDPNDVIREIVDRRQERGTNYIYWADLTYNENTDELEKLLTEMKEARDENGEPIFGTDDIDKVHWFSLDRAFPVGKIGAEKTRELFKLMKEAGCSKVGIGVEGFTPEDLIRYKHPGKEPDLEAGIQRYTDIVMSLKLASDAGLFTRGYFMWGDVGQNKSTEARAMALLQIQIPEQLFEDYDTLQEVVRVIFELQGKDNEGRPYTAEEIEAEVKKQFTDKISEDSESRRFLEVDHFRISPLTPGPGTSVGKQRELRYKDCYKYDITSEGQQTGLLDEQTAKAGVIAKDKHDKIIAKRQTEDGRVLEINIDNDGLVEVDEGGAVAFYLANESGERQRVGQDFVKENTKEIVVNDGRTLDEYIDEGDDDFELFDQETFVIDPQIQVEHMAGDDYEIDEEMCFTKGPILDAGYGSRGYKESMQRKLENASPERRRALESWNAFWKSMGREYDWEIQEDKELHGEFSAEHRLS